MTEIRRWDNNELIIEGDRSIRALVEACAKLGNPSLQFANLVGARLVGASLVGARLAHAKLDGANLDGASLDGASLVGANLDGASLDGASLVGARLFGASLVGARLVGARLFGARLDGANLDGANLVGAKLDDARLVGANLDGANLDGARLPIWCRWSVTYSIDGIVHIGCKSKTVAKWDEWFAGSDEFETSRDSDDFKRIHANYLAVREYMIAIGVGQRKPAPDPAPVTERSVRQ